MFPETIHARLLDCSSLLLLHGSDLYLYDTRRSTHGSCSTPVQAGPSDCACRLDLPPCSNGRDLDLYMQRPSTLSGYHPFHHDASLTIVAILLGSMPYYAPTKHLLVVPVNTLLSLLHTTRQRVASNPDVARNISWVEWGPSGSRLIIANEPTDFSLLGSKLMISFNGGPRYHVYIVELNPLFPRSGEELDHVDYSEHIEPTTTFPKGVTTTFPCRVTSHTVALKYLPDYDLRLVLFHDGWALVSHYFDN